MPHGDTARGIVMMSAGEPRLASGKTLPVAMTRIADQATLIVDSGHKLERAAVRGSGAMTPAPGVAWPVPEKQSSLGGPAGGKERLRDLDISMQESDAGAFVLPIFDRSDDMERR